METVLNYYSLPLLDSDTYVIKSPVITTDTLKKLAKWTFP